MTDDRDSALGALRAELGGPPPAAFERLTDEHLRDLAAALREDRERRTRVIKTALDHALRPLPAATRHRFIRARFGR